MAAEQDPPIGSADLLASDRDLLAAFRRGDAAALERVYRAYVDAVFRLVAGGFVVGAERKYVSGEANRAAQQDLVQEVFVRAFAERARLAYDGLRPYRPFLLRITKNLMIDTSRRTAARREDSVVDIDAVIERDAALTAAVPDREWTELMAATRDFMATQSAEVRRYVELRFDDERPQLEVAREMGISRRRARTIEDSVQAALSAHLRAKKLL
ncbi:MAG TPA: sigma-70 family RNA polymerase sigma factor [Kofleriaceae bacterium]